MLRHIEDLEKRLDRLEKSELQYAEAWKYIEAVERLGKLGGFLLRVAYLIGAIIGIWYAIESWVKSAAHSAGRFF